MNKILAGIISFVLLILFSPFIRDITSAQTESHTTTISPVSVDHQLAPGERTEGTLRVINETTKPITYTAAMRDFIVENNQGIPTILPPNELSNNYSAASWIGIIPGSFTVEPRTRFELRYYIQVPADAKPGGRYAAVMYQPQLDSSIQGSGASVQTQIGTLFYITIKGDIAEDAQVLRLESPSFLEYGPVPVTVEIQNRGDLHIKPIADIKLKDIFGRVMDTKKVLEKNIFPGRSYLHETMQVGGQFLLGRFTIELAGTYGQNTTHNLLATTTLWIIPWRLISIIILFVGIITASVLLLKKKRIKHHTS